MPGTSEPALYEAFVIQRPCARPPQTDLKALDSPGFRGWGACCPSAPCNFLHFPFAQETYAAVNDGGIDESPLACVHIRLTNRQPWCIGSGCAARSCQSDADKVRLPAVRTTGFHGE